MGSITETQWNRENFETNTVVNNIPIVRTYPKPQLGGGLDTMPVPPVPIVFTTPSNGSEKDMKDANRYFKQDEYDQNTGLNSNEVMFDTVRNDFVFQSVQKEAAKKNDVLSKIADELAADMKATADNIKDRFRQLVSGVDYENFDMEQFRILLHKIFNFFPDLIDTIVHSISLVFVELFYGATSKIQKNTAVNQNKASDVYSIKLQIYCVLSIPFTLLIAYNWWYLFTTDTPYLEIGKKLESVKILNFFFESSMVPVVMLNYTLLGLKNSPSGKNLVDLFKSLKAFTCIMIFAFFAMVYFVIYQYTPYFKATTNAVIDTTPNKVYSLVFTIVILSYICIDFFFMKLPIIPAFAAAFKAMSNPITFILTKLVKFIFILITIPLSMIAILLYLVIFSFFGIPIYQGFSHWITTIRLIDYDVLHSISDPENVACFKDPWYMKVIRFINRYSYQYMMYILFLTVLIINIVNVFVKFKSESLKMAVFGFYVLCASIFGVALTFKIRKDIRAAYATPSAQVPSTI